MILLQETTQEKIDALRVTGDVFVATLIHPADGWHAGSITASVYGDKRELASYRLVLSLTGEVSIAEQTILRGTPEVLALRGFGEAIGYLWSSLDYLARIRLPELGARVVANHKVAMAAYRKTFMTSTLLRLMISHYLNNPGDLVELDEFGLDEAPRLVAFGFVSVEGNIAALTDKTTKLIQEAKDAIGNR